MARESRRRILVRRLPLPLGLAPRLFHAPRHLARRPALEPGLRMEWPARLAGVGLYRRRRLLSRVAVAPSSARAILPLDAVEDLAYGGEPPRGVTVSAPARGQVEVCLAGGRVCLLVIPGGAEGAVVSSPVPVGVAAGEWWTPRPPGILVEVRAPRGYPPEAVAEELDALATVLGASLPPAELPRPKPRLLAAVVHRAARLRLPGWGEFTAARGGYPEVVVAEPGWEVEEGSAVVEVHRGSGGWWLVYPERAREMVPLDPLVLAAAATPAGRRLLEVAVRGSAWGLAESEPELAAQALERAREHIYKPGVAIHLPTGFVSASFDWTGPRRDALTVGGAAPAERLAIHPAVARVSASGRLWPLARLARLLAEAVAERD